MAGGPFEYTGLPLKEAHGEFHLTADEFAEVGAEIVRALDFYDVPEREQQELVDAYRASMSDVVTARGGTRSRRDDRSVIARTAASKGGDGAFDDEGPRRSWRSAPRSALRPLRHRGLQRQHVEGAHPVALAGEAQAAEILRRDEISHSLVGRLVDEDLTRAGRRLQP